MAKLLFADFAVLEALFRSADYQDILLFSITHLINSNSEKITMDQIYKGSAHPEGELLLQTVAMPADTNANGDIFGGWLVSQMDLGGAILANQRARNRVTTVAIDRMVFLKPVYVGDLVCCYGEVIKTGHSSIAIKIQVWAVRMRFGLHEQVTEGIFTFVAINDEGRPKEIPWDPPVP